MAKRLVVFLVVKGACYKCQRDHPIQTCPLGLQTDTCSRGAGPHPAALRCLRVCVKGDDDLAQSPGVLLSAALQFGEQRNQS